MPTLTLLDPTVTAPQAEGLEAHLRRRVIGQDEPIHDIVTAYQAYLAGLAPSGRPIGNFLFLGPTGSGKTRVVEATAEYLLDNPRAVIKIDCAEFQHSHEIAKLIGSPPGYLGHRETHALLSQEALNQFHTDKITLSLVLFDEIEKASDALWNLLLGILDKGVLTLGDNRKVDFSSCMVFMTSNLGAAEMNSIVTPRLGFHAPVDENADRGAKKNARICRTGVAAAQKRFTPEFINRLDKIVVFKSLDIEALRQIVDIELEFVQSRVGAAIGEKRLALDVTDGAKQFLLEEGTDLKYGARPLKRTIERLVVQPLSSLIVTGQILSGDKLCITHGKGASELSFFRETRPAKTWELAAA